MTDYVNPKELLQEAVQLAKRKSDLPARDMLIRGILAGAFLGYATSLAIVVTSQGLLRSSARFYSPVGFVMLALLGLELVTGNFALLPAGRHGRDSSVSRSCFAIGLGVSRQLDRQRAVRRALFIWRSPTGERAMAARSPIF